MPFASSQGSHRDAARVRRHPGPLYQPRHARGEAAARAGYRLQDDPGPSSYQLRLRSLYPRCATGRRGRAARHRGGWRRDRGGTPGLRQGAAPSNARRAGGGRIATCPFACSFPIALPCPVCLTPPDAPARTPKSPRWGMTTPPSLSYKRVQEAVWTCPHPREASPGKCRAALAATDPPGVDYRLQR